MNRGGSWNNDTENCRSANRNNNSPDNRNDNLGFRLLSTTYCPMGMVYGPCSRAKGHVQGVIPRRDQPDKKQKCSAFGRSR